MANRKPGKTRDDLADISCRQAVPADVPFLLKLREATMSSYLSTAGIELSPEQSLARVMHRFECAEIVLDGEQPIGLLKVYRGKEWWEIIQIQLRPSVQGQGHGTRLMRAVIQEAKSAQAYLTLSVLRGNPVRKLYESLGFLVTGSDDYEYFMKLVP